MSGEFWPAAEIRVARRAALFAIVLFAAPLAGQEASAGHDMTAGYLLEQCKKETSFCYGYVEAVWDSTVVEATLNSMVATKIVCYPKGVTLGQMTKIVVKYLNAHPEQLQLNPYAQVVAAMNEAFPCKP